MVRRAPIIIFSKQLEWTWPHHTTFVAASGHELDLREHSPMNVMAQARVDSDLGLWKQWADNDKRKELTATAHKWDQ